MSDRTAELAMATLFLIAGAVILLNIEPLARFDQRSGMKTHNWFKQRLGAGSVWNKEIYSVGTPSGLRKSKLGFGIAGTVCLAAGIVSLGFWLARYIR